MNAREIIKQYLAVNKYDGLCHCDTECGCGLDDFAPCGDGPYPDCEPANARLLKADEYIGDAGPGDKAFFRAP